MAYKILAVDDEPSISKLVQVTLTKRGHEVITADNGVEALAFARTDKPDLIVMDVMMPTMDGFEVRKRLKADPTTKDIPIVFLTAVGTFEKQLSALQEGLEAYMTKPFTPSELADLVEGLLDPSKREETAHETSVKRAQLRTIVDIMHRDRG